MGRPAVATALAMNPEARAPTMVATGFQVGLEEVLRTIRKMRTEMRPATKALKGFFERRVAKQQPVRSQDKVSIGRE